MEKYIIYFEWDEAFELYKYVVNPKGDLNKFISFYMIKHDKKDDFVLNIIYTNVDEFNNHNVRKLNFSLSHDDFSRFNKFYLDFVSELDEKALNSLDEKIIKPVLPIIPPLRNNTQYNSLSN
jgi:hypothetical protein